MRRETGSRRRCFLGLAMDWIGWAPVSAFLPDHTSDLRLVMSGLGPKRD
jgi:hypothetical protein